MINVPVLLIAYNRPDTARQVLERIREACPSRFYFAVDGPKDAVGGGKISETREIVKLVDWPCEVHTLFRQENRGCGFGPAEAITWAFENEDRLVVLEDDCVPSVSFFNFCEQMLDKYADDERVSIISGRSHHEQADCFEGQDYIFSHYAHTWGWATWKRVWRDFDIYMRDFPQWISWGGANNIFNSTKEAKFYNKWFSDIYRNIDQEVSHSWDAQWMYAFLKNGALGIVPCYNLIHCIGVGNGTHNGTEPLTATKEMPRELRHPQFVVPNANYELLHYLNHINSNSAIIKQIINKAGRLFK